jgi:hypothetical protein
MLRFPCSGVFASTIAVSIPFNRRLLQSNDISFVAQLSFFQTLYGKAPLLHEKHLF